MTKQEAIEKIKNIETLNIKDRMDDKGVDMVIKNQVLTLIEQIDEPPKVVVPEFIDSYIRYAKAEGMSLFIAMDNAQNKESEWIITSEETFARAWLDGYKVEQEKLYTVEIAEAILMKITRGSNIQYKMLPFILAMLKEEGSDSMEAKLTNNDGLGVLVKISYEPVEVE